MTQRTELSPVNYQMLRVSVLCLGVLWSLVELVHCQQTFPYVSFMGQTLANHSYVDISQVGNDAGVAVVCHTDLSTCCRAAQGIHRGDWYFPDGDRLPTPDGSPIIESRQPQRVELRRNSGTEPTGLYRCDIPTNAVHHDDNDNIRDTVYVGLYASDSGKLISVLKHIQTDVFNPRRACARVTVVVVSVCLSVCLCVCLLSHYSLQERLFVLKTLSRTQWATKVEIFVAFSLTLLLCRDQALPPLDGHTFGRPFFLRITRMCIVHT